MSIFGSIMSAIFGQPSQAQAGAAARAKGPVPSPSIAPAPGEGAVDVEAVLTQLAAHKKEKLDWRKSIVDLMKLLDLDSGLAARKQLAIELRYSGDTNDTAAMNIWLHKQVMKKLADNGGNVPAQLMH